MTKTITLDGLTPVTIKQSPYDTERFCWILNRSGADIYASCVNSQCTPKTDGVRLICAGEYAMIDTASYQTLYLNGSGETEIVTSAYGICPFNQSRKGGDNGNDIMGDLELIGHFAETITGQITQED